MIFLILLLAFVVRLINLNQSLWLDEAIEVLAVKNTSFLDLITKYSIGDFHPPLYHLVLKIWTGLFGYSEISARFPSLLFGVATCLFVSLLGKKLFSKNVGLLAAIFMAINPLAVYYSQEARMYSLAAFAVTASVYFFLEKKWFWHLIFLLIVLYTDYLPWFMFSVFFLLSKNKRNYLNSSLFTLLFVLPWLPFFWQQLQTGLATAHAAPAWSQVVGGFNLKALPLTLVKFIFGRIPTQAIFALPAIFYLWLLSQTRNKILWLWLVIPLFFGLTMSLKISVFSYFRFLFVLPAFVLLLAAGGEEHRWSWLIVAIVSIISLAVFNLNPELQRENWRAAVKYIASSSGIVALPSLDQDAPMRYYGPKLTIVDKNLFDFSASKTVYLIRYVQEIFDPHDVLRLSLEANGFNKTQDRGFNGVLVWKYENRN